MDWGPLLLSSSGGTFDVVNETAIDISNSNIAMILESVSSTNSDYGIELVDNDGSFEITGTTGGTFGNGGNDRRAHNSRCET